MFFEKDPHLKGDIGRDDSDALELLTMAVEEIQDRYQKLKAAKVESLVDFTAQVNDEN